jgi:hypothetical protein
LTLLVRLPNSTPSPLTPLSIVSPNIRLLNPAFLLSSPLHLLHRPPFPPLFLPWTPLWLRALPTN